MALVLVLVVVALLLLVGFVLVVRKGASAARGRIADRLGELDVQRTSKANFFGVMSRGTGQVRGLGTIALTADELVFLQLVPSFDLRVPRAAITDTSVARSFLGKTQGRDLLVITWSVDGVNQDSVAFDIPELDTWRNLLR